MAKLYVVGIGPGGRGDMTLKALEAIKKSEVIVGYKPYMEYVKDLLQDKEVFLTGMGGELERCRFAIERVKQGKNTSIISTGDAGLYGMAGPIFELSEDEDIDIEIVPGVTAAFSAAGELGAPIMHDFCSISLSDVLTPWAIIEKRIETASSADFVIVIYNPKSKGRPRHIQKAVEIIRKYKSPLTPVGIVQNSGRAGAKKIVTKLKDIDYDLIDMNSVVIIGNSGTYIKYGFMVTPRGYNI